MWLRREHGHDVRSRDQPRSRRMSLVPMRVMTGQGTANRQPKLKPPGTIRSGDADRPLWESQRPSIVERDARRRTDTAAGPSPRHSECDLRDSTSGRDQDDRERRARRLGGRAKPDHHI